MFTFTKKSLLSTAVLSLVCAVAVFTVISSVTPSSAASVGKTYNYTGVAAIPVLQKLSGFLSPLDVAHYLNTQGLLDNLTPGGQKTEVRDIKLTNITDLNQLQHIFIPGVPGDQKVYYAQMKGPFILPQHLSLPALNTLIPSAKNLPLMSNLPALKYLPGLNEMDFYGDELNGLGSSKDPAKTLLTNLYAVFNAHNGNLLAWG